MATALNFASLFRKERKRTRVRDTNVGVSVPSKANNAANSLETYRVGAIPDVYYVPNFVNEPEERWLLQQIEDDPVRWTQLTQRRLKVLGGIPSVSGHTPDPFPSWLSELGTRLVHLGVFSTVPNNALINEYMGAKGISLHFDGPLYQPTVAVVSLNGSCMLDFIGPILSDERMEGSPSSSTEIPPRAFSVFLQPRSLVVFKQACYTKYKHGIPTREVDVVDELCANAALLGLTIGTAIPRAERRVSLTIRCIDHSVVPLVEGDPETDAAKEERRRRELFFYKSVSEAADTTY